MTENSNEGHKHSCSSKVRFASPVWYPGDFSKIFDRRKNSWTKDTNSKLAGSEIKRLIGPLENRAPDPTWMAKPIVRPLSLPLWLNG